jgi:hypothetical protein
MRLKPISDWYSLNPFTKVNSLPQLVGGNFKYKIHLNWTLFPSALADGFGSAAEHGFSLIFNRIF